jgi:hypothetical protein
MKNLKYLLSILSLLLFVSGAVSAKDWRGIVPLRSTIEDVERLLGKPHFNAHYVYETEEGRVIFIYQSNPKVTCGDGYNDVPFGTILSIEIELKKKTLLTDFNLDMSKFRQYFTCIGATGYSNREEGIEMHIYDGAVFRLYYRPTAADAKKFACPKANE